MAKKTSKSDALKRAGSILSKTFKVSKVCSTAGRNLATDSTTRKKKSVAGGNLASIYVKPHCKGSAKRKR
jgi:hypothetical protein